MLSNWSRVARRIRVPTGFLFAAFYLWRARPSPVSLAWSLLLVVPGPFARLCLGLRKEERRADRDWPLRLHPQSLVPGIRPHGLRLCRRFRSLWITLLLALLFTIIYVPTIYSEEQFLRATFPAFAGYAQRVPRLLPRLTPARMKGEGSFSGTLYRQHREYNSLLGACAVYAVLVATLWLRH